MIDVHEELIPVLLPSVIVIRVQVLLDTFLQMRSAEPLDVLQTMLLPEFRQCIVGRIYEP